MRDYVSHDPCNQQNVKKNTSHTKYKDTKISRSFRVVANNLQRIIIKGTQITI